MNDDSIPNWKLVIKSKRNGSCDVAHYLLNDFWHFTSSKQKQEKNQFLLHGLCG